MRQSQPLLLPLKFQQNSLPSTLLSSHLRQKTQKYLLRQIHKRRQQTNLWELWKPPVIWGNPCEKPWSFFGPIWAQREVPLKPADTADTIYARLQHEIVELFKETWPRIAAGELKPVPQDESHAVYHKIGEVDALDALDLEATMKTRDVLNLLRARSFGDRGFAYFEAGGQRVYVNLRLGSTPSFASES